MPKNKAAIRIFVGSPGGVDDERKAVFDIIDRLRRDHWRPDDVGIEGYGWDITHYPKLVSHPPQVNISEGLPDMADYDLCLVILCNRLGTPLDKENFLALMDGRQSTEYKPHKRPFSQVPQVSSARQAAVNPAATRARLES
jgi:hypothetical protein